MIALCFTDEGIIHPKWINRQSGLRGNLAVNMGADASGLTRANSH
jgi:hypothetical protein